MNTNVYVISDLHLGGAAPKGADPGFQICSGEGQRLLADFLTSLGGRHRAGDNVHLVVNGDSVDFLAEKPFAAFTAKEVTAEKKLREIIRRTQPVWEAFRDLVASGAEVTFLLGNHDLELSLPGPHRLLLETLGPGKVNAAGDNAALTIGDVLIEHGNRYDGWNAVNQDALRAWSRREKSEAFSPPPGSVLVTEIMNPLKRDYHFVDLLKPEQETVLPIIAILDPSVLSKFPRLIDLQDKAAAVLYHQDGTPVDPALIAARVQAETDRSLQKAKELCRRLGYDPEAAGAIATVKGILEKWREGLKETRREVNVQIVYEAMQHWLGANFSAFDTCREADDYLPSVRTRAESGVRAVIYGHTHLAKRLTVSDTDTIYINTGTWADLMAVPDGILLDDEARAKRQLRVFLDDLAADRLERWRQVLPTFAHLSIENERVVASDLLLYDGNGQSRPVLPGRLAPLGRSVG